MPGEGKKERRALKGLIVDEDVIIQYSLGSLSESSCSSCPLRGFCPVRKFKRG
ncbi:hypothetical protein TCELL_0705 [Thermogladius calderae 1633]|uniref:Uncharacterized protein n=1 Tax=Thermogladius calderae (strain DSM 22663 / VKM B-2946 / 1633) TaxID=1184251 RepID=I3TEE1_THEC1|nr:hypothetical protein [Thermogladius calderae]AFK51129.1 hypothetical protein TCELL_0705 [Thermogladius calderae 1633]